MPAPGPSGSVCRTAAPSEAADPAVRRRDLPTEFHASAPLRIDLAGGGTDVPPFSAREGGVVVKAALRMLPVLGTFTLTTRCDVSPGAGLGRSGALAVALVAALTRARLERL